MSLKGIAKAVIFFIPYMILLMHFYPNVFGQVEIHQSTTVNGKTTSISTSSSSATLKLSGVPGTIKLTEDKGAVLIKYCVQHTGERCKTFKLDYNGTISK